MVLAVGVLLAGLALVVTDSFYAELHVRPEDAGISDFDVVVRGLVYLALPVAVVGIIATGLIVLVRAMVPVGHEVLGWCLAIAVAAIAAVLVAALVAPGLRRFALDSPLHLLGTLVMAVALVTVGALITQMTAAPGGVGPSILMLIAFVAIVIGGGVAVLFARSAGRDLAHEADKEFTLSPGPLDPMRIRATRACILPSTTTEELAPVKLWVKLGASSAGVVLYDPGDDRSIVIKPTRVGVLGVAEEVCHEPGEPVPVETGTPADDAALARVFRPVLRFDSREPWRPMSVDRFLSETFPDAPVHHRVCDRAGKCDDIQSTAELTADKDTIDIRGRRHNGSDFQGPGLAKCRPPRPLLECPDDRSAIYYHVTRQDHRAYVDYWWFLRYDHVPAPRVHGRVCDGPPLPPFEHEGDWEGVTAVSKFNRPDKLDYVAFSGHGFAVRYLRDVTTLQRGSQRPLVYVACGTHAAYPRPCAGPKRCRETRVRGCRGRPCPKGPSRISEAAYDGQSPWDRNADEDCFTTSPCLLPLPSAATGGDGWTTWPGRWGRRHGPRSPGKQRPFRRPWEVVPSVRTNFGKQPKPGAPPTG